MVHPYLVYQTLDGLTTKQLILLGTEYNIKFPSNAPKKKLLKILMKPKKYIQTAGGRTESDETNTAQEMEFQRLRQTRVEKLAPIIESYSKLCRDGTPIEDQETLDSLTEFQIPFIDPITQEPLEINDIVFIHDQCFSKKNLKSWVAESRDKTTKPVNPMIRREFSLAEIKELGLNPRDFRYTYSREVQSAPPNDQETEFRRSRQTRIEKLAPIVESYQQLCRYGTPIEDQEILDSLTEFQIPFIDPITKKPLEINDIVFMHNKCFSKKNLQDMVAKSKNSSIKPKDPLTNENFSLAEIKELGFSPRDFPQSYGKDIPLSPEEIKAQEARHATEQASRQRAQELQQRQATQQRQVQEHDDSLLTPPSPFRTLTANELSELARRVFSNRRRHVDSTDDDDIPPLTQNEIDQFSRYFSDPHYLLPISTQRNININQRLRLYIEQYIEPIDDDMPPLVRVPWGRDDDDDDDSNYFQASIEE